MRKVAFVLVLFSSLFGSFAGCDVSTGGSACEEARTVVQNLMDDACQSAEYKNTPFCTCCVELGYHSVDDDCGCRDLVFDADACLFANGDQGKPDVRIAIEYANTTCAARKLGLDSWDRLPDGTSPESLGQFCEVRAPSDAGTDGDADATTDADADATTDADPDAATDADPDAATDAGSDADAGDGEGGAGGATATTGTTTTTGGN